MARQHGYTGKILRADLSSGEISYLPTMDYAPKFIGGKGIATKIYWDEVGPEVQAFDPENRLVFMTGPAAGIPGFGFGGAAWRVCGKSPISRPEQFSHCKLGGSWGAHLKFAGYDGIVVQGKSEKPVYLFIQDDTVELRDASHLWGKGAIQTREILKAELGNATRVVAVGPAGENRVIFANLLADEDASGSGGLGAVMGSKKLKAITVRGSGKVQAANPEKLREHVRHISDAITAEESLLCFQIDIPQEVKLPYPGAKMKKQICYGCRGHGCQRTNYQADDGTEGKFMCQSAVVYKKWAYQDSGEWEWEVPFYANRLCNQYGIDTMALGVVLEWLGKCYQTGILTDENTNLPLSRMGSVEFIETLLKRISLREGFGDVLAQGIVHASETVGQDSIKLISDLLFVNDLSLRTHEEITVDPRLLHQVALFFAMDMRITKPHYAEILKLQNGWLRWLKNAPDAYISTDVWRAVARRFLGGELAADFSTCEGKALSAKIIHDREAANGSLAFCNYIWPIMAIKNSEDHVGDASLESKVFSAITGIDTDEAQFLKKGETIFNVERAIRVREGHRGRKSDMLPEFCFTRPLEVNLFNPECILPGKNGEIISRKGKVLDREEFETMKSDYYRIRGWDVSTGLQTTKQLDGLGLADVAKGLTQGGLADDSRWTPSAEDA